ncbi:hypothetical protein LY90DRAFT_703790 [Neocallimastix californiae]|jgi:GNAT superfamily N-acetyltransferase|uniref:N-acetyltransferase domain-containing protein n=1 Tax=Neocallimastix californiae TaxID=1754190 RepID=A0A1Y2C7C9_9FUNG|nr:hypothetical protein LY90DRAFT_703790 [Neocallimastix californiae]|eukprot:ORY42940.1 hypothetical protein LY90DRAFT_703790 [Neocallimastix californiae]
MEKAETQYTVIQIRDENIINNVVPVNNCNCFEEIVPNFKKFMDGVKNSKIFGIFDENNNLVSQLFVVDGEYKGSPIKYIFAACTLEKYRKKGRMTALLSYCKQNYDKICLTPGNESLEEFYKKNGFTGRCENNEIKFHDEEPYIRNFLLWGNFEGKENDHHMVIYNKN